MEYYGTLHKNQAVYLKNYIVYQVKEYLMDEKDINILSLGYGEGKFEDYLLYELRESFPYKNFNYTGIEVGDTLINEALVTNIPKNRFLGEVLPRIMTTEKSLKSIRSKKIYHIYLLIAPSIDIFYNFRKEKITLELIYQVKDILEKDRKESYELKVKFAKKGYDLQIPEYSNFITMLKCLIASTCFNKHTLFYEVNHTGEGVRKECTVHMSSVKSYSMREKDLTFNQEHALYHYILPISNSVI